MKLGFLAGVAAAGLALALGSVASSPAATALGVVLLAGLAFATQLKRTRRGAVVGLLLLGAVWAGFLAITHLGSWASWLAIGAALLALLGVVAVLKTGPAPVDREPKSRQMDPWLAFSSGEDPTDPENPASLGQ